MVDIHARYHEGVPDALERTARNEPRAIRNISEVEAPFWAELNDGFVSGMHTQPSVDLVGKHGCAPAPAANPFLRRQPTLLPPACDESAEQRALCAKLDAVALDGEVALLVVDAHSARALATFQKAALRAGVRNVLVLAADGGAQAAAEAAGLAWMALSAALPRAALEALPAHARKYAALRQALRAGVSTLLLEPSVVLVTDPFKVRRRTSRVAHVVALALRARGGTRAARGAPSAHWARGRRARRGAARRAPSASPWRARPSRLTGARARGPAAATPPPRRRSTATRTSRRCPGVGTSRPRSGITMCSTTRRWASRASATARGSSAGRSRCSSRSRRPTRSGWRGCSCGACASGPTGPSASCSRRSSGCRRARRSRARAS
jgi:hypothetical protein